MAGRMRPPGVQVALAALALLVFGVFVLAFADGGEDADGGDPAGLAPGAAPAGDIPALPLDLATVGFENGTVERTAEVEGPGAVSYCERRPVTDGLVSWDGNRLTAADSNLRVSQLVARFRSQADAATYLRSTTEITDCGRWTTGEGDLEFVVTQRAPETVHGDETQLFLLEKLGRPNDPPLYLRTVLIRSGRDVLQLTYVSVDRDGLDDLAPLTQSAVDELGF